MTTAADVRAMGWVTEGEHKLLTQGFLESFWDDEIGWCLTSGGKFFSGLARELVHKPEFLQESPNAIDADVMLLFHTIHEQFLCKVL